MLTADQHTIRVRRAVAARQKKLRSARTDLGSFITSVVQDDHGDALELADIHLAWLHHLDEAL